MASNRAVLKETIERSIREEVEKISVDLLVYEDTQMFIEKGTTLTWQ